MPEMDAALDDELRVLRARAYGPGADISDDPAAALRLRELEDLRAQAQTASAPPFEIPDVSSAADDADTSAPSAVDNGHEQAQARVEERERPIAGRPAFLVRHRRALWISSVIASAAAAAAITHAVTWFAPVTVSSGAPQITTLAPDPVSEVPIGFFGVTEDSPVWEFHGLTFFIAMAQFNGTGGGSPCLNVVSTDEMPTVEEVSSGSYGYSGLSDSACQAGAFPATIEIPLDGPSDDIVPEALRTQFPDGKALQFALDGDHLGVFLDSGD